MIKIHKTCIIISNYALKERTQTKTQSVSLGFCLVLVGVLGGCAAALLRNEFLLLKNDANENKHTQVCV